MTTKEKIEQMTNNYRSELMTLIKEVSDSQKHIDYGEMQGFINISKAAEIQAVKVKAYEWWKHELQTSCPEGMYQSWCQKKLDEFKRAMED